MSLVWSWHALPALLEVALGLTLAALVLGVRPDRAQNRALALLLLAESVYGGSGGGFMYLTDDPSVTWAFQALTVVLLLAMPGIYLHFLSTVPAPLSQPLRSRHAQVAIGALTLAGPLLWFAQPSLFLESVVPGTWAPWDVTPGPGWRWMQVPLGLVGLFGLAVALSALGAARAGSAARGQARAYVVAFGVRDLGLAIITLGPLVVTMPTWADPEAWGVVLLLYYCALAYGILKVQLFDIDLRIKSGVRRSVVAGAFVAAFFLVSEGVEALVSGSAGTFAGLAAAALLLVALRPLERGAARFTDRLMPGVLDTHAYRTVRKGEVYRAAVESAMRDGEITEREREVLATVAEQLGLEPTEVRAVERDTAAAWRLA